MKKIFLFLMIAIFSFSMFLAIAQTDTLPACTSTDVQFLNDTAIPLYQDLLLAGYEVKTTDDLLAYIDRELQWRDDILSQLPMCAEAVELGNVMRESLSDMSTLNALDFAGVARTDNPIEARISLNLTRFTELTNSEDTNASSEPTAIPVQAKTYYVNASGAVNIRSCASTDCGVVATANRGDALTVVDDTGDWYELQLDSGVTGYIADFLVSANRPSTQQTTVLQTNTPSIQPTAVPQQNVQPTAVPVQPTQVPVSTVAVQSEAPAQPAFTCGGDIYNCGDFSTCNDVMAYFNACPGDPSRLDRDNDGVPCESLCGG